MTGLKLVLDFAETNAEMPSAILTAVIFFGLALLNHHLSVPTLDRIAAYLKAGRSGLALPPEKPTFHPTLVVFLPLMLGVWMFLIHAVWTQDFNAYTGDGLVLWPAFGHVAPWLINILVGIFLAAAAGIMGSYVHFFGLKAGIPAGSMAALLAFGSFLGGMLAAPAAIVYFMLVNRGMFIGYPIWALKTLARRSLPQMSI